MVVRLNSVLGNKDEKKAVIVEGVLTDLNSSVAKNGKPYVEGYLIDGSVRALVKNWDIEEQTFYDSYRIPRDTAVVVQISGNLEYYNNEPQIIVKGGIKVVEREGAIDNYIETVPYPVDNMIALIHKEVDKIQDGIMKAICQEFFENENVKEKIRYCPYSLEVHKEKGGWLHHIYNCIAFSATGFGEPKVRTVDNTNNVKYVSLLNKDVIVTAILLYSLSSFYIYDVDPNTGFIRSNTKAYELLFGGLLGVRNVTNTFTIIERHYDNENYSENEMHKISNLKHCISVLNEQVEPATPEAFYLKHLINLELLTFESAHACKDIETLDISRFSVNGYCHKVTRMY